MTSIPKKFEKLIYEKKGFGVAIVIEKDGKYLLVKQPFTKPFGGQWTPPGSSIKPGETAEEAVSRVARNRLNLRLKIVKKMVTLKADYKTRRTHFFLTKIVGGQLKVASYEGIDFGWFTVKEARKLDLMKMTKRFFAKYAGRLKNK